MVQYKNSSGHSFHENVIQALFKLTSFENVLNFEPKIWLTEVLIRHDQKYIDLISDSFFCFSYAPKLISKIVDEFYHRDMVSLRHVRKIYNKIMFPFHTCKKHFLYYILLSKILAKFQQEFQLCLYLGVSNHILFTNHKNKSVLNVSKMCTIKKKNINSLRKSRVFNNIQNSFYFVSEKMSYCLKMKKFTPNEKNTVFSRIRFSHCLYAQLNSQIFDCPKIFRIGGFKRRRADPTKKAFD